MTELNEAYSSNSRTDVAAAAWTSGQLPWVQVMRVPELSPFWLQYAAAAYWT
jgi:hypothetical protein